MKRLIKRMITSTKPLLRAMNRFTGDFPKVVVYHRFSPPGVDLPHRVSADRFAWQLDRMRKDFSVVSLAECIGYYNQNGRWPRKTVVITVDDGYRDFYEWAYPELARRNMTATFFVTVNFVDQKIWLWPDRLYYLLANTGEKELRTEIGGREHHLVLDEAAHKSRSWDIMNRYCISLPDAEKHRFLDEITHKLKVDVPAVPTEEYRALTWDELQEVAGSGIEIGSHTMNHPILSKIPLSDLHNEIAESKRVLEERLGSRVSTLCYPNSGPGDINEQVVQSVKDADYIGAVFGEELRKWDAFMIPRMGISPDKADFIWKLFGGEVIRVSGR